MTALSCVVSLFAIAQSPATAPASSPAANIAARARPAWLPRSDGPWNNDLVLFRFTDGKPPERSTEIAIPHASAPALLDRGGGRLFACFENFSRDDQKSFGVLASSESADGGKSWSKPQRLELKGVPRDDGRPRMPAIVALKDGRIRLYVTLYPRGGRAVIASLISKDGRSFEAEPDRRFALREASVFDPIVLVSGNDVHLFARQGAASRSLLHAISKDGLRFDRLPDVRLDLPLMQPPAIRDAALLATHRGVVQIGTNDGANWTISPISGLPPVSDIASAQWKPGGQIALVVLDRSRNSDNGALAMRTARNSRRADATRPKTADAEKPDAPGIQPDGSDEETSPDDDWPPEPDFLSPIDYVAWIREHADRNVTDNAQPYYFQLLLKQDADGHWVRAFPPVAGMYNNVDFVGDPAPWRPEDHPEWEQSFQTILPYFAQYRAAGNHEGYVTNVLIDPDAKGPALLNFLLPDLSTHRAMCKELLSAAWRAPDGEPDPDAMMSAWQTTLTSAKHLKSGVTLIEELTGEAVANLTYSDARQALAQGAIPPNRLEQALKTLHDSAPKTRDPSDLLAGEAAFAADMIQYVTDTNTPDGVPRLDAERVQEMAAFIGDKPLPPEDLDEILKKDPREISATLRDYYRETADAMRTGYPDFNAKKLDAIADRYVKAHPEIGPILPSLGRVDAIMTRNEASRRATELAYAVNIFKTQQGRWPNSLDELPPAVAADARTDPFTKRDFLYRVGPNGPVIYSASENGKDDGGQHSPRWGDDKKDDNSSDDYVFWPPQPRSKPKPAS